MGRLCIIPARGGSKRIPRKNIKLFLGKPIIAYSIEVALQSQLFDEVMVSTDDEEIARIANSYGAKTPFLRSKETANDHATTFDVLKEVIKDYDQKKNLTLTQVCCIYPTAPLVTVKKLEHAYQVLLKNKFDTVFPVMRFGFPIQRALRITDSNKVDFFYKEHEKTRSQDLEAAFHDAGQFYWFNVAPCMAADSLLTDNCGSIEISEMEGQDIDNEVDWILAELKYELL
jgi:N-acylneuraminate cytidylyltransferase